MRKNARKIIFIKCSFCNNDIKKFKKEYDRQTKKGRTKFYCNLSCAAKENPGIKKRLEYIKTHPGISRKDEYTPFRSYLNKIKARLKNWNKTRITEITPEYLKLIWEKQRGICPYTGIQMELRDYNKPSKMSDSSIDRIDSSKGYIEGNIEFVCLSINFAKNCFSKEETINFVKQIKNNNV